MNKISILIIASFLMMSNAYLNLLAAQEVSEAKVDENIEKKPFDCITELMSQPSCINRLNATNACKMFGGSPEAVSMIQKCVAKQGFHGGAGAIAPANVVALCLAGVSSSNKASDNETYCKQGDVTKTISVSDSTKPKIIDLDSSKATISTSSSASK